MVFLDLLVEADDKENIQSVEYFGDEEEWYHGIDWSLYKHQNIFEVFGMKKSEHENQILEFQGRFFKYQALKRKKGTHYYFSKALVMKELFEQTLEKVNEGVQIYDKNGYFVYSNAASQKLGDYKAQDFVGKHLLDIYELTEEISTTLSVLRTSEPVLNRCDIFKGRDGTELITINSGYPLEIDGKIMGAVSFEGDMTLMNSIKNKSFNLEAFVRNEQPLTRRRGFEFHDIIYSSDKMEDIIRFAKKISLTDTNILISGETGTGKELFAQSIHNYSPRRDGPFVDINCGAVPTNLVESVFFGTEKGAFTGSVKKKGLLELADGGTLFLDEVNSMSLDMQAKLLRALQENKFQRIGGHDYIECNVRIIAASNEDLRDLSARNQFRKDLYYRLSSLCLDVPPLRDRKDDIQILLNHFTRRMGQKYGKRKLDYSTGLKKALTLHDWPGNIRELEHVIEYAVNHMKDGVQSLTVHDLPDYMKATGGVELKQEKTEISVLVNEGETLVEKLSSLEEAIIEKALLDHMGNVTKAAHSLGLSRQSLQYRIGKFT